MEEEEVGGDVDVEEEAGAVRSRRRRQARGDVEEDVVAARSRRRRQDCGDVEEEAGAARTGSGDGARRLGRRGLL